MPSKRYRIKLFLLLPVLIAGHFQSLRAAELSTLFTTPQERQIINSNRYKTEEEVRPVVEDTAEETIEIPIQQLLLEEVRQEYAVSGISVSPEGAHTVWINSAIYEDGAELEDKSRIRVMTGTEVKVRITAPDGKHYYAKSGETLEVVYMAPIEN